MKVRVRHEGAYENGHEYSRIVEYDLDDYATPDQEDFDSWWDQLLFDDTGDGVLDGSGSWYGATIVEADDPRLVGKQWEWSD